MGTGKMLCNFILFYMRAVTRFTTFKFALYSYETKRPNKGQKAVSKTADKRTSGELAVRASPGRPTLPARVKSCQKVMNSAASEPASSGLSDMLEQSDVDEDLWEMGGMFGGHQTGEWRGARWWRAGGM